MLALPRFLFQNLVDLDGATLSASSAAAAYPASMVADYLRGLRWRSTGDTSEWLQVDFGSTQTWDSVIIWDGNFSTSATITFQGSANGSSWTTIVATIEVTTEGQLVLVAGAEQSWRYIRINIADPSNADGYIEVGRLFVGVYMETEHHHDYNWWTETVDLSVGKRTPNGVRHVIVRPTFERLFLAFERFSPTMRASFRSMFQTAGTWMPIWVVFDADTVNLQEVFYVTLDESAKRVVGMDCDQYGATLTFNEEL